MKIEFDKISDESRIWIYQSNDEFTEYDIDIIPNWYKALSRDDDSLK